MKLSQAAIEAVKTKQLKNILEAHSISRGAFDLNAALASAQGRLLKAIELAEAGAVTPFASEASAFIVGDYLVCESPVFWCGTHRNCGASVHCQCSDHKHRFLECKHILATALFCAEKEKGT